MSSTLKHNPLHRPGTLPKQVVDASALVSPSELLGLGAQGDGADDDDEPGVALASSLCYRTIKARNDVLRADSSPGQAADARDAMAKAIYGRYGEAVAAENTLFVKL